MSIRLSQVIESLREREENDEADQCELVIPFELSLIHGFSYEKVLDMTMDEIERWYSTPPTPAKYIGWNSFYWGKEVVG